ncbi:MAG: CHAT domain-containing tetratricopeptide repeat protein [Planctomycetota bacterium]
MTFRSLFLLPIAIIASLMCERSVWSADVNSSLEDAFQFYLNRRFDECVARCREALDLIEGPDDPQAAEGLFMLGVAQWERNNGTDRIRAVANVTRAGQAFEKLFPMEYEIRPDWNFFDQLSRSLKRLSQVPQERVLAWPPPLRAWLRDRTGNAGILFSDIDFETSKWCYEFSLKVAGGEDDNFAHRLSIANNLGLLYQKHGELGAAMVWRDRSHELFSKAMDRMESAELAIEFLNHGASSARFGESEIAGQYYRAAFDILTSAEPKSSEIESLLAIAHRRLAEHHCNRSEYGLAIAMAGTACDLDLRNHGERSSAYAYSLSTLGYANRLAGNLDLARKQLLNALQVREAIFNSLRYPYGHSSLVTSLTRLAEAEISLGRIDDAIQLSERALVMAESLWLAGPDSFASEEVLSCRLTLARALLKGKDTLEAKRHLVLALRSLNDLIRRDCVSLSDHKAFEYAGSSPEVLSLLTGLLCNNPELMDSEIYELVSSRKSLASNIVKIRNEVIRAVGSDGPGSNSLIRDYQFLSRKLRGGFDANQGVDELLSIHERISQRWSQICSELGLNPDLFHAPVELDLISEALPRNSIFLDFYNAEIDGHLHYCVCVLVPGREGIKIIDLGEVERIDSTINAWQIDIRHLKGGRSLHARQLAASLWTPIAKELGAKLSETDLLIISPTGSLNFVPWSALPYDGGQFLIERFGFCMASSAFRLQQIMDAPRRGIESIDNCLIVSNPHVPERLRRMNGHVDEIPLSQYEASRLVLKFDGDQITNLTSSDATGSAFVDTLPSAKLLHLAVHSVHPHDRKGQNAVLSEMKARNPFLHAGLQLSPDESFKNGVVTANDISQLDLSKLELVLLATCRAGDGPVFRNERVASIQAAFHLAGANSSIATLFPVDSSVTSRIMGSFYDHFFGRLSTIEALRLAQLDAIRSGPSVNCDEPLLWASWVIEADPRGYRRSSESLGDAVNTRKPGSYLVSSVLIAAILLLSTILYARRCVRAP